MNKNQRQFQKALHTLNIEKFVIVTKTFIKTSIHVNTNKFGLL